MQDFIGMLEKVASKRPLYERYLRMYERIARTSPGVNASNVQHWTKRNDKWFELAGKKYQICLWKTKSNITLLLMNI